MGIFINNNASFQEILKRQIRFERKIDRLVEENYKKLEDFYNKWLQQNHLNFLQWIREAVGDVILDQQMKDLLLQKIEQITRAEMPAIILEELDRVLPEKLDETLPELIDQKLPALLDQKLPLLVMSTIRPIIEQSSRDTLNAAMAYTDSQLKSYETVYLYLHSGNRMTIEEPTGTGSEITANLTTTEQLIAHFEYNIPTAGVLLKDNLYNIKLFLRSVSTSRNTFLRLKYSVGSNVVFDVNTEAINNIVPDIEYTRDILNYLNVDVNYPENTVAKFEIYGHVSSGTDTIYLAIDNVSKPSGLYRNAPVGTLTGNTVVYLPHILGGVEAAIAQIGGADGFGKLFNAIKNKQNIVIGDPNDQTIFMPSTTDYSENSETQRIMYATLPYSQYWMYAGFELNKLTQEITCIEAKYGLNVLGGVNDIRNQEYFNSNIQHLRGVTEQEYQDDLQQDNVGGTMFVIAEGNKKGVYVEDKLVCGSEEATYLPYITNFNELSNITSIIGGIDGFNQCFEAIKNKKRVVIGAAGQESCFLPTMTHWREWDEEKTFFYFFDVYGYYTIGIGINYNKNSGAITAFSQQYGTPMNSFQDSEDPSRNFSSGIVYLRKGNFTEYTAGINNGTVADTTLFIVTDDPNKGVYLGSIKIA